ncbi:MAG: hypothetical protein KDE55_18440, partial [Novosphingobium sp.]|nr:hypothetical protein [Novosphingobium sp.]
ATGTGTFLAEVIKQIAPKIKGMAEGMWSGYVERDLIPRLHGFELLMASYAMCHMKLDMQLTESGYQPGPNAPRLSVWLTNALEPAEREVRDLFFQPLAEEARGASAVKRQTPIMCVIGNPPYSGESANKGDNIMGLMEAYKMEPGGKQRLQERNPKWINDDYVKFIRMSEDLIARNPSGGVLGFITNHGYLDNPTFRGMRWHLLKTFDKIWVLDLHGNAKKKEVCPDGSPDKNVFDIQQGVALIVAVRKGAGSDELAEVWHGDLWGSRKAKSEALGSGSPGSVSATRLENRAPSFAFADRDYSILSAYEAGISIAGLMGINSVGIVTARDSLTIDLDRTSVWKKVNDVRVSDVEDLRQRYSLGSDARDWRVEWAKSDVSDNFSQDQLKQIAYRPFDHRWTYYTGNSRGFMCYPRDEVMRHLAWHKNLSLMVPKQTKDGLGGLVNDSIAGHKAFSGFDITSNFPLYLYPDETSAQKDALAPTQRTLNLDPKLYANICKAAGIDPADMAGTEDDFRAPTGDARPSEVKVFDYIYGVLHSPHYRATFAEFLKIDFPRVPYPSSPEVFRHVSEKGEALRRLHLMEPAAIGDTPFPFMGDGDGEVLSGYPKFDAGRVFINPQQYFDRVPQAAWEFHIGGYQPAQKWLKDRKGRQLTYDDVAHYQKIVKILLETDRIMSEIQLPLETGEA